MEGRGSQTEVKSLSGPPLTIQTLYSFSRKQSPAGQLCEEGTRQHSCPRCWELPDTGLRRPAFPDTGLLHPQGNLDNKVFLPHFVNKERKVPTGGGSCPRLHKR